MENGRLGLMIHYKGIEFEPKIMEHLFRFNTIVQSQYESKTVIKIDFWQKTALDKFLSRKFYS